MNILLATYLTVSIFAIYHTYLEQLESGISSPLFRMIGFLACALWPLPLGAMLVCKAFGLTSSRD